MHIHRYTDTNETQTAKNIVAGFGNTPIIRLKKQCKCGKFKYISLNIVISDKDVNSDKYNWI